jgi:hypothetical protein
VFLLPLAPFSTREKKKKKREEQRTVSFSNVCLCPC